MDIQEILKKYKELLSYLKKYGDDSIIASYHILEDTIYNLENEKNDVMKKKIIVESYRQLYWNNGALSEFNIWDNDFEERVRLNKPLEDIHEYLWSEVEEFF